MKTRLEKSRYPIEIDSRCLTIVRSFCTRPPHDHYTLASDGCHHSINYGIMDDRADPWRNRGDDAIAGESDRRVLINKALYPKSALQIDIVRSSTRGFDRFTDVYVWVIIANVALTPIACCRPPIHSRFPIVRMR